MPAPLTFIVGAKGDTITIPANHGFNYISLGGSGFDGKTAVYKYRLLNNFSPIIVTFRDATDGEDDACSPYYPSYTPQSAWIPIVDGVEIYQSRRLTYVSGENYGPGPFPYCAAGTAFEKLTFFATPPRIVVRVNLRMRQPIPTKTGRQVSRPVSYSAPGYRRISLRPQQPVKTNLRVAAAVSPPVKTTGTVNNPPTLNAPVIVGPTQNTIGPTTPQTTPCLFTKPPTAIYSGSGCGCVQSKTTLTVAGCPQTVITYACAQCPTPSAPTYTAPVTVPRTVTAPSSGNPIVINQGLAQKLKAPPPGSPTPTRVIVRRGVCDPIQVVGPDFSRVWNGGKKYDLHQSVPCDSVLTKKRRYKLLRLQENASTRLAGAPLLSEGEKFGFIVGDPEMALTSFKYGNGDDTEDLAKRDLGKRWRMANWSDFANASESDLLGFMQTFDIIDEDLSTENGVQHIVVVGWIKYQNNIITENGENYLVVYCNKSLPSSITPVATLLSNYWVLVANTNDYMMSKIICKK